MESLGEKLKKTREGKKISLEKAGLDTKISIRYLKALENEDFSCFPGEAYIFGFLRNYGTYLDLNIQELLSLYRALKLQEQPVPVEQLLKKTSSVSKIAVGIILGIIIAGLIGSGIYYFLTRPKNTKENIVETMAAQKHEMTGDTFERLFFIDDSIEISSETNKIEISLTGIGDYITILTDGEEKQFDAINDIAIPIDDSGLIIKISALPYEKDRPENGVYLHFIKEFIPHIGSVPSAITETMSTQGQTITAEIFISSTPYPFTLQSAFQNYCMFRWEILMERDRRDRREQFFQRADELNIQANNGISLWVSNAQAVKFQVIGAGRQVPVEIGSSGEVVVCEIKWVRGTDNRFRLVVARLET